MSVRKKQKHNKKTTLLGTSVDPSGTGWMTELTDLDGVLVEGDVHLVADLFHLRSRQRIGAQVPARDEPSQHQV